ncbi:MAG: glucuronate isomerase, partial [Bryobacteraceae bacterium]
MLDVHTHLYPSSFRKLSLWGIDELVTYHYLIAELFRSAPLKPADFWNLPKTRQADLIWETLFVRNTPLSEAARGIVAVLQAFGLNPNASSLREARDFFVSRDPEAHIRATLTLAGVSEVVMTNDVFDETETYYWEQLPGPHPLFHAVLRMDPLLNT